MGKVSKMLLNGGKLAGNMQMDRRFMLMEKMSSGVCLLPPPGYIHVSDQNIQRSSSLKPVTLPIKAKLYVEHR